MNENLNLVEILKDCPKGTKLYSLIYGDVELEKISNDENDKYPIFIRLHANTIDCVAKDGRYLGNYDGECVLFPSRTQRDWSKFNPKNEELVPPCEFKDGDILSYQCRRLKNRTIYIYRYDERFNTAYYVALSGDVNETFRIDNKGGWALNGYSDTARFATEEEKQKLFDAIKENGYKWNAETKTLEKLIKSKFDPKTLKEFDKVLVKDDGDWIWRVDIISVPADYNDNIPYLIGDNDFDWIIPYNDDTKHLVGTTDEAPEYYRYWEK